MVEKANESLKIGSIDEVIAFLRKTEEAIPAGMRPMGLEAKTGKSYEQVVKDFEERTKQVESLDAKAKGVQGQIQGLMERKAPSPSRTILTRPGRFPFRPGISSTPPAS